MTRRFLLIIYILGSLPLLAAGRPGAFYQNESIQIVLLTI